MRNIASELNISAAALYNHFPDKKSLYQETVARHFATKAELLLPLLKSPEKPLSRLHKVIEVMCSLMDQDTKFRRLVQWELLNKDEERLKYLAQEIFSSLFEGLKNLIKEIKPEADAQMLTIIILGMIQKPFEISPLSSFTTGALPIHNDHTYIAQQVMQVLACYLGE
jgi:AcrR family transcriptional regulator